jgi:ATP phosphoribosyltransferase
MFDDACHLLESAGYVFHGLSSKSRKLTFDSADGALRVLMIRGADVLTYVEHGGADIGVVGLDLILEQGRHVLEPLDLKFGLCRLVVASPTGKSSVPVSRPIRVATKYPRLAEQVGMADQIVDLVATGKTLRENQMEIREEILVSTARLVVNRASWSLKNDRIRLFMDRILPFLSKEQTISEG